MIFGYTMLLPGGPSKFIDGVGLNLSAQGELIQNSPTGTTVIAVVSELSGTVTESPKYSNNYFWNSVEYFAAGESPQATTSAFGSRKKSGVLKACVPNLPILGTVFASVVVCDISLSL